MKKLFSFFLFLSYLEQHSKQEVRQVIEQTGGVGTFIAESVVGCGGQILLPPGYLKKCYELVRTKGRYSYDMTWLLISINKLLSTIILVIMCRWCVYCR